MDINPLKRIYENNQCIAELNKQIKAIEAESQKCLDYVMVKKITEVDNFVLRTSISKRREPIAEKVWKLCGDDARKYATFQIKGLEKILSQTQIDSVCKVKETITRVVEMVE